jgi:D-alanyl-D-alanine carboxypeptidase (penicillin-binding protein 5/6)
MTPKFSHFGRVLTAALLCASLGAIAYAATPAHKPGSGLAHRPASGLAPKKDARKEEIAINAPHAILIDAEYGAVLYERDPDVLIFPASLGKLATVEYVFNELKQGRLNLTDEFTVSEHAWRKGGAPSHTSSMFVALNSKVSVDDLLHGAIIQSGNDACIVLAEGIAGTEGEFAEKVTARARTIGLKQSVFTNANGLPDPGEKVTTRELGLLARKIILDYPEMYKLFGEREYTWNKIRQQNRNPLLAMGIGADGLKTGFTNDAGYGLVGSAVQNGQRLIVVVNGEKSDKERADDAKKLLEWGFRSFEQRILFGDDQVIGSARVFGGSSGSVPLKAPAEVKVLIPKAGGDRLIARIVYTGPVPAPIVEGQPIGVLKVWRNDNVILEMPLKAAENVGRGNLTQRAVDGVGELMVKLFRAGAERL